MGKQVLSFLVKMIWISHKFFSLVAKFWVIFLLYWTKNLGIGSLLLRLLTFLRCCSVWGGGVAVTFSLVTIFMQRLVNNTGRLLSWISIFVFGSISKKWVKITSNFWNYLPLFKEFLKLYLFVVHFYALLWVFVAGSLFSLVAAVLADRVFSRQPKIEKFIRQFN